MSDYWQPTSVDRAIHHRYHIPKDANVRSLVMPFRIGPMELIIILVIVMIIFGVGRLTDIGGALGKSIREFRKSSMEDTPEQTSGNNDRYRTEDNLRRTEHIPSTKPSRVGGFSIACFAQAPTSGTYVPSQPAWQARC